MSDLAEPLPNLEKCNYSATAQLGFLRDKCSETHWLFVEYSLMESKKSFWIGSIGADSHKKNN